jgi:hypothetical protein
MSARAPRSRRRLALLGLAAVLALGACTSSTDVSPSPVTSGTINGVAFHVTGGTIYQPEPDGPIYGDSAGGAIVLDQTPAGLGMTDPARLQLRTLFTAADSGSLRIAAFGNAGDELESGLSVFLEPTASGIDYRFYLDGTANAPNADTTLASLASPGSERWVVTEFYAQDVPGYGAGSGITVWPVTGQETAPVSGDDVLGCAAGPAMKATTLNGSQVAYEVASSWIVAVEAIDSIVGPCI